MKIERTTKKHHLSVVVDVPTPTVEIPKRFKARLLRRFTPTTGDIAQGFIKTNCPLCYEFPGCSNAKICPFYRLRTANKPSLEGCAVWMYKFLGVWMLKHILISHRFILINKKHLPVYGTKGFLDWRQTVIRQFELFRNRALKHIRWV